MENLTSTLQRCMLFRELTEEIIESQVLPAGEIWEYAKNSTLISAQETVDWFAVILQGRIQIEQIFADGERSLMNTLRSPAILGADMIFTRSQHSPYFAVAPEDVKLIAFQNRWLTDDSDLPAEIKLSILKQLTTLISHENMRKFYRIAILSQKGLRNRVLTYLTMQSAKRDSTTFSIPFNREELAAFLCVNRSALSHELSLMEQEGFIKVKKNLFTVCLASER